MLRAAFVAAFDVAFDAIAQSENVTKRELKALSRTLLAAIHGTEDATLYGDIQFINRLLTVLTPVNRKVAVKFFEHFTGFHYSEQLLTFTKKSKKRGVQAQDDAREFLADPNNNIWSWAERHIDVEVKPFTALKVTKFIEGAIKKLDNNQAEVLKAVLAGGITLDTIIAVMQEMGDVEVDVKQDEPAPF